MVVKVPTGVVCLSVSFGYQGFMRERESLGIVAVTAAARAWVDRGVVVFYYVFHEGQAPPQAIVGRM